MASLLLLRLSLESIIPGFPILVFIIGILACALLFDRGSGMLAAGLGIAFSVLVTWMSGTLAQNWIGLAVATPIIFSIAAIVEALQEVVQQLTFQKAEISRQTKEKDDLLQDAAHRVRNDLSILSAMIRLQKGMVKSKESQNVLDTLENRLAVLVRVHQRLFIQRGKTSVDSRAFFRNLIDDLRVSLIGLGNVQVEAEIESHTLSHQHAVSLGLIINESLTNAIKYAFDPEEYGTIQIDFKRDEDFTLSIRDSGTNSGVVQGTGLGSRLMSAMAAQVNGKLTVNRESGTEVVVVFPPKTSA